MHDKNAAHVRREKTYSVLPTTQNDDPWHFAPPYGTNSSWNRSASLSGSSRSWKRASPRRSTPAVRSEADSSSSEAANRALRAIEPLHTPGRPRPRPAPPPLLTSSGAEFSADGTPRSSTSSVIDKWNVTSHILTGPAPNKHKYRGQSR